MAINPLQPPINYLAALPQVDLGQQFAAFGQALAQRQEREAALNVQKQYAADLQSTLDNPTQKAWSTLIAKYPSQREAFKEAQAGFAKEQLNSEFNQGSEISMALENNNPDVAKAKLQTIIEAKNNSGEPTGIYQQIFDALDSGNVKGAQAGVNMALSLLDPGKFQEMVEAQGAAAAAPSKLRAEVAAADTAVAEAEVKVATAKDDIAKAKAARELEEAKAKVEAVTAKYAEQVAQADLKKKAADLGLTQAQTNQALATTKKLGIESQKTALELKALQASGGVDPTKKFEYEEKLRKEYNTQTKPYQEVKSAYGRVLSSENTAVGDISLIFGYMKMLDPGSVVREGEFATAQNAAGVPDRVTNLYNKVISGQRLNPSQRDSFKGQAKGLYNSALEGEKTVRTGLERISKDYGLKTENIFYSPTETAPTAPGAQPPANTPRNVQVSY